MATNLMVMMDDRPGELAKLGNALGNGGVNLAGACAITSRGQGMIHLLVEGDPAAARQALANEGIDVAEEREVLVLEVADEAGILGRYAERIAESGANIQLMYVATGTRLVFGVDDIDAARAAVT